MKKSTIALFIIVVVYLLQAKVIFWESADAV